jgi:hypothetical protein
MTQMLRRVGAGMLGLNLVGCYTLQPSRGVTPVVGEQVAFDVNDAGRAALGGSMGPEIGQIEGRLLQRDTTQYVVAVSAVRLIRGGEQTWSGEPVKIKPDYVATTYTRHFSKARTVALGAIGVGAVAFVVTRSLSGGGDAEQKVPNDTVTTRISGRP